MLFGFRAFVRIRTGTRDSRDFDSQETISQNDGSNNVCHPHTNTMQCHYSMFLIKYIIQFPFHSASQTSLFGFHLIIPCQDSLPLSLSHSHSTNSLLPDYSVIPLSPSGPPSDYSGPNPHQMLTHYYIKSVQKSCALHSPLLKRSIALNATIVFCNFI